MRNRLVKSIKQHHHQCKAKHKHGKENGGVAKEQKRCFLLMQQVNVELGHKMKN